MAEKDRPRWLPEAQPIAPGNPSGRGYVQETNHMRGALAANVLDARVLEAVERGTTLNLLIVGIGIDNDPLRCPYEPYYPTALLESLHIDYTAVLLDIDPRVIKDVRDRRHIYFPVAEMEDPDVSEAYLQYRRYADVLPWTAFNLDDFVEPITHMEMHENEAQELAQGGICILPIPQGFAERMKNGKVTLVEGNIVQVEMSQYGKFDYAVCMNVLYHLNQDEQKLAMYRIAQTLNDGAVLLLNDRVGGYGNPPMFAELGGWLGPDELQDLELIVDQVIYKGFSEGVKDESMFLTLRKIIFAE